MTEHGPITAKEWLVIALACTIGAAAMGLRAVLLAVGFREGKP